MFYFINWAFYVLALVIWNILFFWLWIPMGIWLGKSILVDSGIDAVEELKENFNKENIVKVVKKEEKSK